MLRKKTHKDFKSDNIKQNIEAIKFYFEKKQAVCSVDDTLIYKYGYEDKIRNEEIMIFCTFNLKEQQAEIILTTDINEESSTYEIDDLLNNIFADIFKILMKGENRYVVRVYGRYYLNKALKLNDTFKWKSNINISDYNIIGRDTVYNVDNITTCPKEHILYCDIEVKAYNLTAARSMAHNLFSEFTIFLSVLLDLEIEQYTTKENILLIDQKIAEKCYNFGSTFGSNGFHDTELNILVFDNTNGLIAITEDNKMVLNNYINFSANDTVITHTSYNETLEILFKDRKFKKQNKQYKRSSISNEIAYYNSNIEIISEHISFFRILVNFEKENNEKYNYFYNSCKLYTYAHYMGKNNPTAMIAYFVASIETLSKTESKEDYIKYVSSDMQKFVEFCKKYSLNSKFDEEFLKYLYGKIRSGHFHSGESYFFEYDCNFDICFKEDFLERTDIYLKARKELRKVIINWIRHNILSDLNLQYKYK